VNRKRYATPIVQKYEAPIAQQPVPVVQPEVPKSGYAMVRPAGSKSPYGYGMAPVKF
jgi:hypothetical protein